MKKNLSILMVLTLIVLFALTWYCSRKAEQVFMAQINTFNQTAPGLIEIELQNYQRKLFSSTARTAFHIQGKDEVAFVLNHQIRHFIWGVKVVTALENNSALQHSIATTIPLEQMPLITDISLQGESKSTLEIPELSFQNADSKLTVAGFKLKLDADKDLTVVRFTSSFDGLQLQQGAHIVLDFGNLQVFTQTTHLQEVPLGSGKLSLGTLRIEKPGTLPIEFQDIQYQGLMELNQGTVSSAVEMTFAQLQLAEEAISNGRIKLVLAGVDSDLLVSLQETARQLQLKALDRQANPLELQLQLLGLYAKLLSSGITLNLEDFSLRSGDGDIKGNGILVLVEKTASGGLFSPLEGISAKFQLDIDRTAFLNGYRIVSNLRSGSAEKQNPVVLAEQAEQIAAGLVQKGFFVPQHGDRFHLNFSWDEGDGKLNGEFFRP